jgi:hypothetical protein
MLVFYKLGRRAVFEIHCQNGSHRIVPNERGDPCRCSDTLEFEGFEVMAMRMPFGKFKGEDVSDIEDGYLAWCLDNVDSLSPTLRRAMEQQLGLCTPPAPVFETIVAPWYRTMAKRFHPDHGGTHEQMIAVNIGRDLMMKMMQEAVR